MRTAGWAQYPQIEADVRYAQSVEHVAAAIAEGPVIARGLGRSYGDSSLGQRMVDITGLDAFTDFDGDTGVLTCEAGVSLNSIISVLLPRGWFLPVTPGTRFVTVGGSIASDVHGKNHHSAGSFSDYVESVTMMLADGSVVTASRTEHGELFHATCGGMGLTGVILSATIRMIRVRSSSIDQHLIRTPDLETTLAALDEHRGVSYSVAWIDLVASGPSLGRSLVMLGEHAEDGDLTSGPRERVTPFPLDLPAGMINRHTVSAFNAVYYRRPRRNDLHERVSLEKFFYPLDSVGDWYRVYGRHGFLQYQFVVPFDDGPAVVYDIVGQIAGTGLASPLAVLKSMGPANDNLISFPTAGLTLAVDLQVSEDALDLCDRLDRSVLAAGGRVYLTKDSRMSPSTLRAGYPRLDEFEAVRAKYGAAGVFVSAQSQRLGLA